ncbi:MAG: histidine kinase [Bacteroidales bacterium]|nr:histidine kinase [Bacteroidales bacterium]
MTIILKFLKKRYVQHSTAWILLFLFLLFLSDISEGETRISDIPELSGIVLLIITATYTHFYILKYLLKRRYVLYAFLTVATICIISAADVFVLQLMQNPGDLEAFIQDLANFSFIILLTTGMKFIKKGIVNQYQIRELKAKQLETEFSLLKAQVNPHFLFNTLNNMYALSLKKADKLSDMLLELSDLMRYQLESSKKTKVNLYDEINYLENYVNLERIRIQKFCNVEFNVSGSLIGKQIAPLLFIPFIENAFKYGISAGKKNYINILFKITETKIYFYVENNILVTKKPRLTTGTGIDNVKKRLNILYPNKYLLNINEQNNIFSVKLNIEF